jgi:hypothetical protein
MTSRTLTEQTRIGFTILRAWTIAVALIGGTATGVASAVATGYAFRDQERQRTDEELQAAVGSLRVERSDLLQHYVTREELLKLLGARFDYFEDRLMKRLDRR